MSDSRATKFRILGHLLLWCGFIWVSLAAFRVPITVSQQTVLLQSDGLPRKDSYSREELHAALDTLRDAIAKRLPWIFPPAVAMLAGGLLLARASARQ
jgi:hypothetical protein